MDALNHSAPDLSNIPIYTITQPQKRNKIGSFVGMWTDLETVIESEVSQKEKKICRLLTHICGI